MEDNKNDSKPSVEQKNDMSEKIVTKLAAVKAAKALSNKDSKWTLAQEILQEVVASHIVANNKPSIRELKEELIQEIKIRYESEEETKTILIDSIPTEWRIKSGWMKKPGWDEAVWAKVRGKGLFSNENRAEVVRSLYLKATMRQDVSAAKLWLTLSGDYSESGTKDLDKTVEAYREINEILHKKGD